MADPPPLPDTSTMDIPGDISGEVNSETELGVKTKLGSFTAKGSGTLILVSALLVVAGVSAYLFATGKLSLASNNDPSVAEMPVKAKANGDPDPVLRESDMDSHAEKPHVGAATKRGLASIQIQQKKLKDKVIDLAVEVSNTNVRLEGLKESLDRARADQVHRSDRMFDALERIQRDVNKRRR